MKINIALLQMTPTGTDQDASLAKGEQFCRQAAGLGADVALFPEMWNNGYTLYPRDMPGASALLEAQAIRRDGAYFTHFQKLAAELNMAIALTYLEEFPGAPRDTVSLIDRHGQVVLTYAKVHTCDFDREALLTPGDAFVVCPLDTAQGAVMTGAMVCYDREFPESARILMLEGAELILVPNACEMEENRTGQLRTRAYENMVAVALANYAGPENKGHSVAFDPIAFSGIDGPSRDMLVIHAGEEEGVYLAAFDLEQIRDYRKREAWGNAYRKPSRYRKLLDETVEEPFIRADARR